eukprot:242642_1
MKTLILLILYSLYPISFGEDPCNYWVDTNGDRNPFDVCIGVHVLSGGDTSAIYHCNGNQVTYDLYENTAYCNTENYVETRNITKYVDELVCNPSYSNCDYIHIRAFSYGTYFGDENSNNGCDQQNSGGIDLYSTSYTWKDAFKAVNYCNDRFGFYWQCNNQIISSKRYEECGNETTLIDEQIYDSDNCFYNFGWAKYFPMECVLNDVKICTEECKLCPNGSCQEKDENCEYTIPCVTNESDITTTSIGCTQECKLCPDGSCQKKDEKCEYIACAKAYHMSIAVSIMAIITSCVVVF